MRKRKPVVLSVTSFRLPPDIHDYLRKRADAEDTTMTHILVRVLRLWYNYENAQSKQPAVPK